MGNEIPDAAGGGAGDGPSGKTAQPSKPGDKNDIGPPDVGGKTPLSSRLN